METLKASLQFFDFCVRSAFWPAVACEGTFDMKYAVVNTTGTPLGGNIMAPCQSPWTGTATAVCKADGNMGYQDGCGRLWVIAMLRCVLPA